MASLESVDSADLEAWLDHVNTKETTKWLMIAIAHKRGVSIDQLAEWYALGADEIREWFESLSDGPLVTAVAEREGIDFVALAGQYGLSESTVRDWFDELADEPPDRAIDLIARYSQQRSAPVFRQTRSRVNFLDYEAIDENGWSIDDDDLFEKASNADLGPERYGRVLVRPGETILEAVEDRGYKWPYACRAGACANCAVLVKRGDIAMPGNNVLSEEQVEVMNARLTCVGVPVTDEVDLVMNVQHLDQFSDLRLPSPIEAAGLQS